MSMSQRLSDEAVSASSYSISPEALSALRAGDVQALIASHRDRFSGWKMEKDDDDSDDEDEDSDENEDEDSDDEDEDSDDDENGDEDSPEDKKSRKKAAGGQEVDSVDGLKRKNAALEDEKNRLHRGRQRARQERDEARKEVERLKSEGVSDDALKKENKSLQSRIESQEVSLREALMQIAFLSDNTYEWQNPGLALKAADLSDVEIDDDGKVHGLKSALEKLATDNPFLLKKRVRSTPAPTSSSTGKKPPAGQRKKQEAAKREAIRNKYRIGR